MTRTDAIVAESGEWDSVLGSGAAFAAFSDSFVVGFSDGSWAAYFDATYEDWDWTPVDLSWEA